MLHEKSCLIINMPKIMIIKYQQFAKTNTFSLSFHILFSPFLHIFSHFFKTHRNQDLGMGKNGVGPPSLVRIGFVISRESIFNFCTFESTTNDTNWLIENNLKIKI